MNVFIVMRREPDGHETIVEVYRDMDLAEIPNDGHRYTVDEWEVV